MSAPILWIFMPLILGGLLMLVRNQKAIPLIGCIFTLVLTLAAWLLPVDTVMTIGNWSFKIGPSITILGRRLVLGYTDQPLLALIYGSTFVWFASALAIHSARHLYSLGLAIVALLVAALSVEPFLYAALLIEMAVLLSIPLLSTPEKSAGKGLIRFLILQTLGIPFILFSGWLLAGIDANPGDLGLVQQAAILIGFGFAFLLAIFPFNSWIPLLMEEASPIMIGFILWMFPHSGFVFRVGIPGSLFLVTGRIITWKCINHSRINHGGQWRNPRSVPAAFGADHGVCGHHGDRIFHPDFEPVGNIRSEFILLSSCAADHQLDRLGSFANHY